jgi:hypothetical protein
MKTTKTFLTIIFLGVFYTVSFSQPVLEWADTLNIGSSPSGGEPGYMVKDKYSNVFISVTSDSVFGNKNILTVKYRNDGTIEWTRSYDHSGLEDVARGIKLDRFGNIYVLGNVRISSANSDAIVLKYLPNGALAWARRMIPAGYKALSFDAVTRDAVLDVLTPDTYMFVNVNIRRSSTSFKHFNALFKVNLNTGSYTSVEYIPPDTLDEHWARQISIDALGHVYVTGYKGANGFVMKYSNSLFLNWRREYSPSPIFYNDFRFIKVNSTGKLIVSGPAFGGPAWNNLRTYQLNSSDGSVIWERRFYISDTSGMYLDDIVLDFDDNVILAGSCNVFTTSERGIVLKYNSSGIPLWSWVIDSMRNASKLGTDPGRNIYISGYRSGGDARNRLMKLDPWGFTIWSASVNGDRGTTSMLQNIGSKIFILGTDARGFIPQVWVQSSTSGKPTREIGEKYIFKLHENYPNPFNPSTSIKFSVPATGLVTLKVFDITGKEVTILVDGNIEQGEHEVNFNASHLASGVYFYKLISGSFTEVKKMMLIK